VTTQLQLINIIIIIIKLTSILNQYVLPFSETSGQPHIQQVLRVGGIATRYGLGGLGIESCPDQPRGPRSLPYKEYRPIPRGKAVWVWRSPPNHI